MTFFSQRNVLLIYPQQIRIKIVSFVTGRTVIIVITIHNAAITIEMATATISVC